MAESGAQTFLTSNNNNNNNKTESKLYNKKVQILGKNTLSWQNLAHNFPLQVKNYDELYNKTIEILVNNTAMEESGKLLETSSLDEVSTNYFHKQILHFHKVQQSSGHMRFN
jgi:uncharacterized protein (DUF1697 family)